jgi:hypothetical protein
MKFNRSYLVLAAYFLFPVVLLVLPADFFDGKPSICLSHLLFNRDCYGCGITRACMRIIHLDFTGAASFNRVSFIVFPVLAISYLQSALRQFSKIKTRLRQDKGKIMRLRAQADR